MKKIVAGIVLWVLLGLPGAGMLLADLDYKFPGACRENAGFSYETGVLFGPLGSLMAFFKTGFAEHGFQFQCK